MCPSQKSWTLTLSTNIVLDLKPTYKDFNLEILHLFVLVSVVSHQKYSRGSRYKDLTLSKAGPVLKGWLKVILLLQVSSRDF